MLTVQLLLKAMIPSLGKEYKIQSEEERHLWSTYLVFIILSSLTGDSIILLASVRQNTFKLNKLVVVVVQHIAVADLIRTVSFFLPTAMSLSADRWVLGDVLGHVTYFLDFYSYQTSNILISVLTSTKLLILKYPTKARFWSEKGAHLVCACVWIFCFFSTGLLFVGNSGIAFNYILYKIYLVQRNLWIIYTYTAFATIFPTLAVILTTIPTIRYLIKAAKTSNRAGGQIRWQGMVTVTATATVHCVFTLPNLLAVLIYQLVPEENQAAHFERATHYVTALKIMCNFNIYCLTISSFRQFIKSQVRKILIGLLQCCSYHCRSRDNAAGSGSELEDTGTDCRPTYWDRAETAATSIRVLSQDI